MYIYIYIGLGEYISTGGRLIQIFQASNGAQNYSVTNQSRGWHKSNRKGRTGGKNANIFPNSVVE